MLPQNRYPAGSTQYIFFATYGSSGQSITLTGLAVTDIEIYKNGSTTQRASDAGYALLDTDGIDFDAITGIHGFSINLGDNTDAGFYAVGSKYVVVVSAVTVDGQTVSFIADRFEIVPAESVTGYPVVDVAYAAGTAVQAASGRFQVDVELWLGVAPNALASGRVDVTVGAMQADVWTASAVATDAGGEIADAVLDEVVEGTTTMRQLLRGFAAALMGKASGLGTATAIYRDIGDTKDRLTATVDSDGNRSAVTKDLT